ncbi:MAG: nitrate/nitrite transporter NrtS [Betaproteobacteria bacterium]|nr:nitrate/nitrite transporter NrtS [Betaproteobacteria bacterium]
MVVSRAGSVALIVGSMLNVINHYDLLLGSPLTAQILIQMGLTYIVPYCVSTHGQAGWRKGSADANGG